MTLDSKNTIAGSVAVTNGKISDIWFQSEPPSGEVNISDNTKILNLKGATMLPGFIDTHNHIIDYSQARNRVNCSSPPNQSIDNILEAISKRTMDVPIGEWVVGYGYDDTLLSEKRHPTRFDLDKVSPNHPVFITHISGHLAVVNSKALELVGIDECVSNDNFGKNNHGKLNGVLYEQALDPFNEKIPDPTEKEMIDMLGEAAKDFMAEGITTSTDAAVGSYSGIIEYEVHLKAAALGINPLRSKLMIMHDFFRPGAVFAGYNAKKLDQEMQERSKGLVRLDSAKMFQDGSIQGLTGALREPYHNKPNLYGQLFHEQKAFNEEIFDLHNRGFRIAIHGNGDRAIESIIDGFQFALEKTPRIDHRHRIEHVQTATLKDLDRMQDLQLAGSFFINHVYYWGDRHQKLFLGPERASRISPIKDAVDRQLLFTLHSDCPITPISPLFSVWSAVNRVTREGEILGPDQRCDVVTALKAMTIYGAQLNFDEENSGSIEIGKHADFAVLEKDPTKIDPIEIKDISILYTLIGGKIVFEKESSHY
ncbi:N-substituted formamide deformylase precursor [Paraliobacillus sp. PM-2]|uniref:amidohydrolase n=1 Tax=Paraliobacillus sp. PM-2 TaxID=1462524 RepID=UPI00061C71C8|nr:amidohydrolase [Paraliobacillus sp. PM-2]CQR45889.1 N-substituted formamide deformylase precursor [Paraliobacillus sp. PM-2]